MTDNNTVYDYDLSDYDNDDIAVAVKNVLNKDVVYTSDEDAEHYFWMLVEDVDKYEYGVEELDEMFSQDEVQKVYEYLVNNFKTWNG